MIWWLSLDGGQLSIAWAIALSWRGHRVLILKVLPPQTYTFFISLHTQQKKERKTFPSLLNSFQVPFLKKIRLFSAFPIAEV